MSVYRQFRILSCYVANHCLIDVGIGLLLEVKLLRCYTGGRFYLDCVLTITIPLQLRLLPVLPLAVIVLY